MCAVRGQAQVLLGRLEVIAPGGAAAAQRRNNAHLPERRWAQQRRADALSNLVVSDTQSDSIQCLNFAKK